MAEKVGAFKQQLDDPTFPRITYRHSASGQAVPVLRGTGIRVQTIAVAAQDWKFSPTQIATEYSLSESQVNQALAFYRTHRQEIDAVTAAEQAIESFHG